MRVEFYQCAVIFTERVIPPSEIERRLGEMMIAYVRHVLRLILIDLLLISCILCAPKNLQMLRQKIVFSMDKMRATLAKLKTCDRLIRSNVDKVFLLVYKVRYVSLAHSVSKLHSIRF